MESIIEMKWSGMRVSVVLKLAEEASCWDRVSRAGVLAGGAAEGVSYLF